MSKFRSRRCIKESQVYDCFRADLWEAALLRIVVLRPWSCLSGYIINHQGLRLCDQYSCSRAKSVIDLKPNYYVRECLKVGIQIQDESIIQIFKTVVEHQNRFIIYFFFIIIKFNTFFYVWQVTDEAAFNTTPNAIIFAIKFKCCLLVLRGNDGDPSETCIIWRNG